MLHPYLFTRVYMRIFIFLLISILVHLVVVSLCFTIHDVPNIDKREVLSVVVVKENTVNTLTSSKKLNAAINVQEALETTTKAIVSSHAVSIQHEALNDTQNMDIATNLTNYYANTEVDRKALPQMNIDQSMLPVEDSSGLPIKLRLYINAYGMVVKVEPISVLDQDVIFVEKLAKLLYEIRFLPAKREGLDVDSYQDLLLSFNPLPISGVK
jgi:hypothetical protein